MVRRIGFGLLTLVAYPATAVRVADHSVSEVAGNPIRRVVNMLQAMQKKVGEEGERDKVLYDKFMCYCKTSGGDLTHSIAAAEKKTPAVSSDIESSSEQQTGLQEALKQGQVDRSAAKSAQAEATAIREKEATAFAAEKAEYDANIAAIKKAVASISKGMSGGFLQTGEAQLLKRLALGKQDMVDADRQELLSFLTGSQVNGYVPQSGEISGILQELGDTMEKNLADATKVEQSAITSYAELMSAKKKEVDALSGSIESKTRRIGELAVAIVQMKEDLSDTQEALLADQKFLAELDKGCATKTSEWDEVVKTRAEELTALAETIKILNDDDALDLFKKTLPSPGAASLVQMKVNTQNMRAAALSTLQKARTSRPGQARFDLIALALHGKKIGFEKVIKMIDEMAEILKQEQVEDDHKKEYCNGQLDTTDDKKKNTERAIKDAEAAISTAEEGIATLKEEMSSLEAGIKALDKAVADATEQRKEEHKAYTELMASNAAAKDLLGIARNRLNKFYNPKLYVAPPKSELSREERISVNMGVTSFVEMSSRRHRRDAPAPPPATFGAYSRKGEESTGVIAMVDLLIKDLTKEMTVAETDEKDAQTDYEAAMKSSAVKRTADSKLLTEKTSTKADLEGVLESHKENHKASGRELHAVLEYIHSLHLECDWLLQNFEVRKEARAGEVDSLSQAKAVLSGADFSLAQAKSKKFLGRFQ